jgi:hypothetical protein
MADIVVELTETDDVHLQERMNQTSMKDRCSLSRLVNIMMSHTWMLTTKLFVNFSEVVEVRWCKACNGSTPTRDRRIIALRAFLMLATGLMHRSEESKEAGSRARM